MTNRQAGLLLITYLFLARSAHPETTSISSQFRSIVVEPGQTVDEVTCTGCSVEVRGASEGDVITFGGDIILSGSAKGDVVALGGSIHLLPRSYVEGDATAIAGSVRREPGSYVSGDADSIPYFHLPGQRGFQARGVLTFLCVNVAIVMLTGVILRPKRARRLAGLLRERPVTTLAAGMGSLLLGLVLILLPGLTHTWTTVLTSVAALVVLLLFLPGYAGVNLAIGDFLLRGRSWCPALFAGSLLTTGLQLVPIMGFFLMFLLVVSALGCSLLNRLGVYSGKRDERADAVASAS